MQTFQLNRVSSYQNDQLERAIPVEAVAIETPESTSVMTVNKPTRPNFLEANTNAISLEELRETCVVPTWANQELTISHQDFINTIECAAQSTFYNDEFSDTDIRVSHIVRGRVPSAINKLAKDLLESEKTQFYQRLAFAFTIPTIWDKIDGKRMELCIGGVRNYSDLNLYRAKRGTEKFSIFIGWRMNICSNQVLSGNGVKLQMEISHIDQLYKEACNLFQSFIPEQDAYFLNKLTESRLTETQFAQIVGRMRLYQALPNDVQKSIPKLLITDSQVNSICRDYYNCPNFGKRDNSISMFDFLNLLTAANKSSYIDSYIQRGVNATEMTVGIDNALYGDSKYAWFLG